MGVFTGNVTKDKLQKIQRALNELTWTIPGRVALSDDGIFGAKSVALLTEFQKFKGFHVTGTYTLDTEAFIDAYIDSRYLTDAYVEHKALENGLPPDMVFAILSNESRGYGFLSNSRTKILYERHIFYRYYSRKVGQAKANALRDKRPDLCNNKTGGYLTSLREWDRLDAAMQIDPEVALQSASMGIAQVMGFNWHVCQTSSVYEFLGYMMRSEYGQFDMFLAYVLNCDKRMPKAMRDRNYTLVAEIYNGPNHAINNYAPKLKNASEAWRKKNPR